MNHMARLNALVAVKKYVDANPDLPDTEEVLVGVTLGDLRTIVRPTIAEGVR